MAMMNVLNKQFPETIMGLYELNLSRQTLYPIKLPKFSPNHYRLKSIVIFGGIGLAEFERGMSIPILVNYNQYINQYSFVYNDDEHVFEIKASLTGLIDLVEVQNFNQGSLY